MVKGTAAKRSGLDAEHLTARLRECGVEQLRDEDEWSSSQTEGLMPLPQR